MNILTGWIHHSAYTALLCLILYCDYGHVFALAAFMEVERFAPVCYPNSQLTDRLTLKLPTFILALAMLVPATRSDVLFSTVFFLTRIAFHAVLSETVYSSNSRN